MLKPIRPRLAVIGACILVPAVIVIAALQAVPPLRVLTRYPWSALAAEATTMDQCAECHDTSAFHTCQTCHDDHGAVEMSGVPFNNLILLTGDVPNPTYIAVHDILPYHEQPATHIAVLDLLAQNGVRDFESVSLASTDGGLVTIDHENLTPLAFLVPYTDGVRFAAEDLHVSTWLKGIARITVIGNEKPLRIDGQETSIGRLLLGPVVSVTLEQTDVLLTSETDGQTRKAKTSSRQEGALVRDVVANPDLQTLRVRTAAGQEHTLNAADVRGAVLALIRGQVTLVLPERGRSQWISGVVEITSQK